MKAKALELTLRQRKILYMLQSRETYTTSGELAETLRVSSRTVRNEIRDMNSRLAPYGARIESVNSKGFLFQAEDPQRIRSASRLDAAFLSRAERIRYLAIRLCTSDAPVSLYDLEEEIFVSRTALLSDLRSLKQKYSYNDPYIRLTIRNESASFEQDELKIRSVLLSLFHLDWDYNTQKNAYYGFHFLDAELLAALSTRTPRILSRCGIRMDDPSLTALILTAAIMDYRLAEGHPFPDCLPGIPEETPAARAAKEIIRLTASVTGRSHPEPEYRRIAEFISHAQLLKQEWEIPGHISAPVSYSLVMVTRRYLSMIREMYSLDFTKDAEFVRVLEAFIQETAEGNSIFTQHPDAQEIRRKHTAEFELAWLFQSIAPGFIRRFLTENELCSLSLCFEGAIRHYGAIFPEKKLQAVLFTHRNMAAAWNMKRRIQESCHLYLEIKDVFPSNYMENYDASGEDLILTTVNRPLTTEDQETGRASEKPASKAAASPEILYLNDLQAEDNSAFLEKIKELSFRNLWPPFPHSVRTLLKEAWWHEEAGCEDPLSVIELLTGDYIREGLADEAARLDIAQRENRVSFALKDGLVFLHTNLPSRRTRLSAAILSHRIRWNGFRISTVIMGMFSREELPLLFQLLVFFNSRSFNADELRAIRKQSELISYLLSEEKKS